MNTAGRMLLAVALAGLGPLAWAADERVQETLGFADHLRSQGDYYRAITEYERALFLSPSNALTPRVRLQIAACYLQGKKWDAAIPLLQDLQAQCADREEGRTATLWLADAYYFMGSYNRASALLDEFERRQPPDPRLDTARLKQAACQLRVNNVAWTQETLDKIPTHSPARKTAEDFSQALPRYQQLPQKSPGLAAGLSTVLPGAGQLYIQRPGDALISLLVNGLLIGAAAVAYHNDEPVAGSFILVFESGWYLGNIYNAVNGAHKFNQRQREGFFDQLQLKCGLFQAPGETPRTVPAVGVGLRY
jgi:tetratricopeptide (TPR) repeat protein